MKKSSIKNLIFIVAAVVILLVLYVLFIKSDKAAPSSSATLTSSSTGFSPNQARTEPAVSNTGDSLLRILNNLENLELNDSIFFNPAFAKLRDISIPLVKEGNAGRRNPFAAIGNDPVPLPLNNGSVGEVLLDDEDDGNDDVTTEEDEFGLFGS